MWQAFRSVYGKRVRRITGKGPVETPQIVEELLRNHAMDYDVLGGHVRYGIGRNCSVRPYNYFTVLRDPTSVVLSRYYKKQIPEVQDRKANMKPGSFEENKKRIKQRIDMPTEKFVQKNKNVLVRFLCCTENPKEMTRRHLEEAKEYLSRDYLCYGIVERYSESMKLIAKTLGWEHVPQVELRNKGGNRPPKYDPELLEFGREVNALDYELYDFAQKLFDDKLSAL